MNDADRRRIALGQIPPIDPEPFCQMGADVAEEVNQQFVERFVGKTDKPQETDDGHESA